MKIALTMFPENIEWEGLQQQNFPLSIYLLTKYLQNAGYDATPLNYRYKDEFDLDYLAEFDLIGFSCDSFNYAKTCEIARKINIINPKIKVLFGGVHVSHRPTEALEKTFVDYVIRGEGENSLVQLVKTNFQQELLKYVPSLSYKIGNEIFHNKIDETVKLDSSALLPTYELMKSGMNYLPFETSRGCHNKCSFCSINQTYNWRPFSEKVVLERLEKSLAMVPDVNSLKYLSTTDDCFTTDPQRAINILKEVTRRYPQLEMRIQARIIDLLKSDELMDMLAECNVNSIQIGVECGYPEGLKLARKAITIGQIQECAEKLGERALGKRAYFAYMIGLPWETKKECLTTIAFANEIFDNYSVPGNIALWFPFPAKITSEYEFCKEEWYTRKGWWQDNEILLNSHPKLSKEDLNEIHIEFSKFIKKSRDYLGISLK